MVRTTYYLSYEVDGVNNCDVWLCGRYIYLIYKLTSHFHISLPNMLAIVTFQNCLVQIWYYMHCLLLVTSFAKLKSLPQSWDSRACLFIVVIARIACLLSKVLHKQVFSQSWHRKACLLRADITESVHDYKVCSLIQSLLTDLTSQSLLT